MTQPGWLCTCGHWQNDDFHCELCGNGPPWGCDCGSCGNAACKEDLFDDEEWYFGTDNEDGSLGTDDDEDDEDFDDEKWEDE